MYKLIPPLRQAKINWCSGGNSIYNYYIRICNDNSAYTRVQTV